MTKDGMAKSRSGQWAVGTSPRPVLDLSIAVEPLNGRQALVTLATYTDMACDRRQQPPPHLGLEHAQDESRGTWSGWIVRNVSLVLPTAGTRRPRHGPSLKHRHMVPLIRVCRHCQSFRHRSPAVNVCVWLSRSAGFLSICRQPQPAASFLLCATSSSLTRVFLPNSHTLSTLRFCPSPSLSLCLSHHVSRHVPQRVSHSASISHRSALPSPSFTCLYQL
jgi:hypothetical protein